MATISLAALLTEARKHTLTQQDYYTYLEPSLSAGGLETMTNLPTIARALIDEDLISMLEEGLISVPLPALNTHFNDVPQACAVGEMVCQLAILMEDCFNTTEVLSDISGQSIKAILEKCVLTASVEEVATELQAINGEYDNSLSFLDLVDNTHSGKKCAVTNDYDCPVHPTLDFDDRSVDTRITVVEHIAHHFNIKTEI